MAKAFVRTTTVKEYVKGRVANMRIGEEAINAIDKKIEQVLDQAIQHAVADKRQTIKARDIG